MKKQTKIESEFMEEIMKSLSANYSKYLSKRIKRGIANAKARKLSTLTNRSLCKE